jgi:intein-encoded DNA endonuclease-like protein
MDHTSTVTKCRCLCAFFVRRFTDKNWKLLIRRRLLGTAMQTKRDRSMVLSDVLECSEMQGTPAHFGGPVTVSSGKLLW